MLGSIFDTEFGRLMKQPDEHAKLKETVRVEPTKPRRWQRKVR